MFENLMPGMSGPDFLDQVAEAELHAGNLMNREAYLKLAHDWRATERALERAQAELEGIKHRRPPPPAMRAHAITPTDRT